MISSLNFLKLQVVNKVLQNGHVIKAIDFMILDYDWVKKISCLQFEAVVFDVFRFEKNKGTDIFQKKIAAQIS